MNYRDFMRDSFSHKVFRRNFALKNKIVKRDY